MTYQQQVLFWRWATVACYVLGGVGVFLWAWHPTTAATVAGVFMGPLGLAGGVMLTYEYEKVKAMDDTEVITYVTRGELRKHAIGAMALTTLLLFVFVVVVLHLLFGVW